MNKLLILTVLALPQFALAQKPVAKKANAKPAAAPVQSTPVLSDAFARAGLKALILIGDDSDKTKEALEDVKIEMDAARHRDEVVMWANLLIYQTAHFTTKTDLNTLRLQKEAECYKQADKTCSDPRAFDDAVRADSRYQELTSKDSHCSATLERAFRDRVSIEYPKECK